MQRQLCSKVELESCGHEHAGEGSWLDQGVLPEEVISGLDLASGEISNTYSFSGYLLNS